MRHRTCNRSGTSGTGVPPVFGAAWVLRLALLGLSVFLRAAPLLAQTATSGVDEPPITAHDREHWAFQPLARAEPPQVKDAAWPINAIDRFVLARLEAAGLKPAESADKVMLIRRVTFDLTGLPPTPGEVDAFVSDTSPEAYEHLVDRLLASPAYGERSAQHWLDLARFAESDGFEHDKVRPDAWKYRDWVIDALNADMPYDRFLQLQIAGDEIQPGDAAAAIATGFALCGPDMPDINLQEERRHMVLNELTGTVGSALLGLQFGCAACHDHKYDPISQADFYRLRAFFDNVDLFKPQPAGRVLHESSAKANASYLMVRGDYRRPGAPLEPAYPRIADLWNSTVPAPAPETPTTGRRAALARWLTRPDHPLTTRVIVNRLWQHHFVYGLVRTPSDFGRIGEKPTHPELLDWLATELPRRGWSLKQMHKLMVTSATYRQASAAPQDKATSVGERKAVGDALDPENKLLWHMNRRRLEGEAIRDAMLASARRLSTRRGGPGVMPPLPTEIESTLLKGQWTTSPDEEDHRRRSIYLFVRRNLRYPLFEVFDRPDTNASCPRRSQSTIAPQALTLLNSEFSLDAARHLAGAVLAEADPHDPAALVQQCFRRALSRAPTANELTAACDFLAEQSSQLDDQGQTADQLALPRPTPDGIDPYRAAALTDLCLGLFNLNEFVYVD